MHDSNGDDASATDSLAAIVRAAGRRAAPPKADYDQVYAAAHATWQRRLRAQRQRNWYALAAAVAVLAIGGILWQSMPTSVPGVAAEVLIANGNVDVFIPDVGSLDGTGATGSGLPAGTQIRTGSDGAMALRLADGGSIRLNSNTMLEVYESAFELDAGTLYFDSAGRRPDMPINVVTPLGTVRDIGTQFEIRTSADSLRVRIRSGSIALLDTVTVDPIAGLSGEEIRLGAAGQLSRRDFSQDDPEWAWAESLAVVPEFETPSVLRYLTWIAEETGKTLDFESETVRLAAELARFLGDPQGLVPTELLVTIAATSDFDFEITDHGTILIRRDTQPE